jgi:hypothetical protein
VAGFAIFSVSDKLYIDGKSRIVALPTGAGWK